MFFYSITQHIKKIKKYSTAYNQFPVDSRLNNQKRLELICAITFPSTVPNNKFRTSVSNFYDNVTEMNKRQGNIDREIRGSGKEDEDRIADNMDH